MRWPQGEWKPGGFPPPINLSITLILLILMGVRGGDYFFGDDPSTARRLSEVEAAMPLMAWGVIFLGASALGFGSIILRNTTGLIWSHVIAWAAYWALAMGLVIDVYNREPDASWFDEYVAGVIVIGILVVMVASRNSEWPLTPRVWAAMMFMIALVTATADWDGLRNASAVAGLGALNAAMAFGTASAMRQQKLREVR